MLNYVMILMIVCAFASSRIAARKGHNATQWWVIGLVPVFGVMLALMAYDAAPGQAAPRKRAARKAKDAPLRKRPKRCCGHYIPECWGCPFFRRNLFVADPQEAKRGYCEHFKRELTDRPDENGMKIIIEDE